MVYPSVGRLSKSVAGGTDVTLTTAEARNQILEFTGTLTANINVIVPAAAWECAYRLGMVHLTNMPKDL